MLHRIKKTVSIKEMRIFLIFFFSLDENKINIENIHRKYLPYVIKSVEYL